MLEMRALSGGRERALISSISSISETGTGMGGYGDDGVVSEEARRVLVVDDEPNIRDLVEVALRFHGFAPVTAATGDEAIRHVQTERPDLIVLDVMLPDVDGFEVCRRLRAAGHDVPVIFLTARDTPSDTVTGLTLG